MTFNAYDHYKDFKRRERRWDARFPFILVGILLGVFAADAYLLYKAHHAEQHIFIVPYTKLKAEPVK